MVNPHESTLLSRYPIRLGWACMIAGVFTMFVSLWLFFIYGLLYLGALGLSLVALSQKRILAGVSLLLVLLVVPTALWLLLTVYRGATTADHGITSLQKQGARMIEEGRRQERQAAAASSASASPTAEPAH